MQFKSEKKDNYKLRNVYKHKLPVTMFINKYFYLVLSALFIVQSFLT